MPFRFGRRERGGRERERARELAKQKASERAKGVRASTDQVAHTGPSKPTHADPSFIITCQTMANTRPLTRARRRETFRDKDMDGGAPSAAANKMTRGLENSEELLQSLVGSSPFFGFQRLSLKVCGAIFIITNATSSPKPKFYPTA